MQRASVWIRLFKSVTEIMGIKATRTKTGWSALLRDIEFAAVCLTSPFISCVMKKQCLPPETKAGANSGGGKQWNLYVCLALTHSREAERCSTSLDYCDCRTTDSYIR
jgi:hypothetical protein